MIEFDIPDVKHKSRFLNRNFKEIRHIFKQNKKYLKIKIKEHFSEWKGLLGIKFEFNIFVEDEPVYIYINSKNELQIIMRGNNSIIIVKCTTLDNAIRNYSRK